MPTPEYDATTLAYIKEAQNRMAANHGLATNGDPREIMHNNNSKLRDAAKMAKRKKGMVRQVAPKAINMESVQEFAEKPRLKTAVPARQIEPEEMQVTDPQNDREFNLMMSKMFREQPDPRLQQPQQYAEEVEDEVDSSEYAEQDLIDGSEYADTEEMEDMSETMEEAEELPPPPPPPIRQRPKMNTQALAEALEEAEPTPIHKVAPPPRKIVKEAEPIQQVVVDYDAFSDVRGLPSRGVCYPSKLMGQAFKLIDVMTLGDIDEDNVVDIISEVFSRRIKGVKPEDILTCDEAYLLHWLRASSFTDQPLPMYPFECPECKDAITDPKDLENINLTFANLDFTIDGNLEEILEKFNNENGCYTFILPDGRQCDIYMRRRSHSIEVDQYLASYKERHKKAAPTGLEMIARSAVLVEIEGCETIHEKIKYIGDLPVSQAKKLLDEMNSVSLNTEITANVICPHCGKAVTIKYPFRLDYYLSSL